MIKKILLFFIISVNVFAQIDDVMLYIDIKDDPDFPQGVIGGYTIYDKQQEKLVPKPLGPNEKLIILTYQRGNSTVKVSCKYDSKYDYLEMLKVRLSKGNSIADLYIIYDEGEVQDSFKLYEKANDTEYHFLEKDAYGDYEIKASVWYDNFLIANSIGCSDWLNTRYLRKAFDHNDGRKETIGTVGLYPVAYNRLLLVLEQEVLDLRGVGSKPQPIRDSAELDKIKTEIKSVPRYCDRGVINFILDLSKDFDNFGKVWEDIYFRSFQ